VSEGPARCLHAVERDPESARDVRAGLTTKQLPHQRAPLAFQVRDQALKRSLRVPRQFRKFEADDMQAIALRRYYDARRNKLKVD